VTLSGAERSIGLACGSEVAKHVATLLIRYLFEFLAFSHLVFAVVAIVEKGSAVRLFLGSGSRPANFRPIRRRTPTKSGGAVTLSGAE